MKLPHLLASSLVATMVSMPAWGRTGGGRIHHGAVNENAYSSDWRPFHPEVDPPFEEPDTTYLFVGARGRFIVIPEFYGLLGSAGRTAGVPAGGPEFTIRKNGFDVVLSAMFASYVMDQTPYKAKGDGDDAWEIVDSNMRAVYFMSEFLWSTELKPKYSIVYGGGVGLAAIVGDIHRVQAYPGPAGPGEPFDYQPCIGPGNPNPVYCGTNNDHYGNYSEPSWVNGGSKPVVFPWLSVQTGFRFKPFKQAMIRVDVGWNLFQGPFGGLAVNYGL